MDVPKFHQLEADPKSFLEGVRSQIHQKLVEEILALKGVKFQLALKVLFWKGKIDKEGRSGYVCLQCSGTSRPPYRHIRSTVHLARLSHASWRPLKSGRVMALAGKLTELNFCRWTSLTTSL